MAASPWPLGVDPAREPHIVLSCLLTGTLIAAFAIWATHTKLNTPWQEWVVVYLGIWLLIAPNTWNYTSIIMTWNNVLVGLAVLIFGVWRVGELSEGRLQWRRSDEHDDRRRAAAGTPKPRKKRVRR